MSLSQSKLHKMRNKYDHGVARFLASWANENGEVITYQQLSNEFGKNPRLWGDTLGGIALRCYEHKLPLLPVIVVKTGGDLPSTDAILYEHLGLKSTAQIRDMQVQCFQFDWASTLLGR